MTLENEPPRSEVVQYATGEEQKATANSSRNYEVAGPKWKQCSCVDGESTVRCCKEQYHIGNWNVRPKNQGIRFILDFKRF